MYAMTTQTHALCCHDHSNTCPVLPCTVKHMPCVAMTTGAAAGVHRGHSELHSHSQEPGEAEAARGGV